MIFLHLLDTGPLQAMMEWLNIPDLVSLSKTCKSVKRVCNKQMRVSVQAMWGRYKAYDQIVGGLQPERFWWDKDIHRLLEPTQSLFLLEKILSSQLLQRTARERQCIGYLCLRQVHNYRKCPQIVHLFRDLVVKYPCLDMYGYHGLLFLLLRYNSIDAKQILTNLQTGGAAHALSFYNPIKCPL